MNMTFTNGVLTVLFQQRQWGLAEDFEYSVGEVVGRFVMYAYCSIICQKTSDNSTKLLSE